ncbi:hypothetical protein ABZ345_05635 [Lentzea sp. NPDC005914]|uniref:hypothetical protein n=1 Tax=Lentzea sp. NPDC005914 TaxID=3154572 RepID=UPI0033ECE2AD
MSRLTVSAVGAGATFVLAAVAGVLGNQLKADAWWPWLAFLAVLVIGTAVTAVATYRTAAVEVLQPSPPSPTPDGGIELDGNTAAKDGVPSSQANVDLRTRLSRELPRASNRVLDALSQSPTLCRFVADARSADAQARALHFVDANDMIRHLRKR